MDKYSEEELREIILKITLSILYSSLYPKATKLVEYTLYIFIFKINNLGTNS